MSTIPREAVIFVTLFTTLFMFTSLFTFVSAELSIPDELMSFYARDVSSLTISNTSIVLYNTDRTILYYLYYNSRNETLHLNISIDCVSKNCPPSERLSFDYLTFDDTVPYVKKAAGVFIMSNASKQGDFSYAITLHDAAHNYTQQSTFGIKVISSNFWSQFWYNLVHIFW